MLIWSQTEAQICSSIFPRPPRRGAAAGDKSNPHKPPPLEIQMDLSAGNLMKQISVTRVPACAPSAEHGVTQQPERRPPTGGACNRGPLETNWTTFHLKLKTNPDCSSRSGVQINFTEAFAHRRPLPAPPQHARASLSLFISPVKLGIRSSSAS